MKTNRDIIVIGASAGGVEALATLAGLLPENLPASLFVVLHTLASRKSLLPQILSARGPLPATAAVSGQGIERGHIHVAPPDLHMLVRPDRIELLRGPKVNGHRPAVDPLFRSAAEAFGPRVIGVVLTGGGDCGAGGIVDIKARGGVTVVQDPASAPVPEMPEAALDTAMVDHRVPLADIAALLVHLVSVESIDAAMASGDGKAAAMTNEHQNMSGGDQREWNAGEHTDFSCPDCGGVLRQVRAAGNLLRFRCRIGHALSADSLGAEQASETEVALSAAMRLLTERSELSRRIASRAENPSLRASFEARARRGEHHADLLRRLLLRLDSGDAEGPETRNPLDEPAQ